MTGACEAAKVGRRTVYKERQRNEDFALAWADIEERVVEGLEREAIRRATESSDTLLIFLLKANRPEKYRENVKVEHSGKVQHGVGVDLPEGSAEELQDLADTLAARRGN